MIKTIVFGIILYCIPTNYYKLNYTTLATETIVSSTEPNLIYCKNELVTVRIGSTLYEGPNPNYFYIKVEIKNTSNTIIGLDLNDKWKIIYPNQWGNLETPERVVINESRIVADELDSLRTVELVTDFKNKKLKFIEPRETFIYFTEFNANGKSAIDETSETGNFFYLSLNGQLFLTNGNKCERISFEGDTKWIGNSVISKPLIWDKIVNEELIFNRN